MSKLKTQTARKWSVSLAATTLALIAAVAAASPASASERWTFGQYNCGSTLILTSERSNDDATHVHNYVGNSRSRAFPLPAGAYVWTHYNSGYTNTGWSSISSVGDISNGSRSCDY